MVGTLPTLVPTPVGLPDRAGEVRASIRSFLAEELAAGYWRPRVDSWFAGWDERFSRELGARGWLGMTLPTRYGGRAGSALDRYVVIEELVAAGAPVAAHWVADQQVGPALLRFGTERQRDTFLPGIVSGRTYFGIAVSEQGAGSDAAAIRTAARRVDGGWSLTGVKTWVSGALGAHALVLLARCQGPGGTADDTAGDTAEDRRAGMTQFIVPTDGPGVTVRPITVLTGQDQLGEVALDEVFVPDSMVLGEVGAGWTQLIGQLAFERSGPEQFLSTFPLLRELVAGPSAGLGGESRRAVGEVLAKLWTLRQMSLGVAGALGAGQAPELAASLVKELGTRLGSDVIDAARLVRTEPADPRVPGGYPRLLADAVLSAPSFTLRGGSNEVLRGIVARGLGLR